MSCSERSTTGGTAPHIDLATSGRSPDGLALPDRWVTSPQIVASPLPTSGGEQSKCTLYGFVNATHERAAQLFRYGATSLLALMISECTLLFLVAMRTNATIAALAANAAGIIPSCLLSRYWIWPGSSRTRLPRQIVLYVLTSIVTIAITSAATGGIATIGPRVGAPHLVIIGSGFLLVTFALWVAKFVVYEHVIFPDQRGIPR